MFTVVPAVPPDPDPVEAVLQYLGVEDGHVPLQVPSSVSLVPQLALQLPPVHVDEDDETQ